MKKKNFVIITVLILIPLIILAVSFIRLNRKQPVTLTLWHNYGGQMKNTMDEMIDEFNDTVGAREGIFISVTSISGTATLHEKLTMAANKDPGAPKLPDITTSYPNTALILSEKGLLADLDELFTKEELSGYIPRFIEEGRLNGGHLYVFPTAKSTEVLFVNMTIFNRFAGDCGVSLDELRTFEGIEKAAALYYDWSDRQTPDTLGDGKTFYVADSLFNYNLIGSRQLGTGLLDGSTLNYSDKAVSYVWESYFKPAVFGHYAVFDGYASDLAKTGDIVCSTGSTAGVLFLSPTVTYADNTTEPAELAILPYPVFEGGEKIAIQRGAGMCINKSDRKREKLAKIFLKWFTSPANNLRFVSSTGYLPVTEEAFGDIMLEEINTLENQNIKKLLQVSREMQLQYEFYISPLFDGVDELISDYEADYRALAAETKEGYASLINNVTLAEDAGSEITEGKYDSFISELSR